MHGVLISIISNILAALFIGILSGIVSGLILGFIEKKSVQKKKRRLTRILFNILLIVFAILSPSKIDDARMLHQAFITVPVIAGANLVANATSGRSDKNSSRAIIDSSQPPSPDKMKSATTFDTSSYTRTPYTMNSYNPIRLNLVEQKSFVEQGWERHNIAMSALEDFLTKVS